MCKYVCIGPKRQETKGKLKIGKEVGTVDFGGETLSMLGTIYKNKAQGTFVERNVSPQVNDKYIG